MTRHKAPRTVETLTHAEASRKNIPTAEFRSVMDRAEQSPVQVAYERRNRDLDPQLVWRGKDAQDAADLVVQGPPLYIQEKVHPKVLIDDLRGRTAAGRAGAGEAGTGAQPDLFADFNGLPDGAERTEFYRHDANWSNRMILGDSLQVMASLAEREGLRGKVQCIYLDPPYGIRFNSNFQWSTASRDVKDGKAEHITREPEQVKAFRDTWRDGIHSYLTYLRDRLLVARELLTESGSIFVQIGNENVHRVRAVLDEVFGQHNHVATISFQKTGSTDQSLIPQTVDYILVFARDIDHIKHRRLWADRERGQLALERYDLVLWPHGQTRRVLPEEIESGSVQEDGVRCQLTALTSARPRGAGDLVDFIHEGCRYSPGAGTFKSNETGLIKLSAAGRLRVAGRTLRYLRRIDDFAVVPVNDRWESVQLGTGLTYVVQTSNKVVGRCILMATDPGDLVLDPTCGSGTTAYVAEQWGRRWITIDTSRVALALARARIMGARYPWYLLADSPDGQRKEAELAGRAPAESPTYGDIRQGFVYERVPHITLKSIANNAEIDVLYEQHQPAVEAALADLNAALDGHLVPFPVETGGRKGQQIDFMASGEVTLPSGEPAPANGFLEWEVPHEPGTPWPEEHQRLHTAARPEATAGTAAQRRRAERALATLNAAHGQAWTRETLPERPVCPWPAAAEAALAAFWEARIARQHAIDASIAAKAEYEYLYDKPCEDRGVVRVAGPFTVESLSPHRVLAVDEDDELIDRAAERRPDYGPQQDFAALILQQLATAGVQQAHRDGRIAFSSITPWPGTYICAEGRFDGGQWAAAGDGASDSKGVSGSGRRGGSGRVVRRGVGVKAVGERDADRRPAAEKRAGIFIGPEFGTVTRPDLVAAAREAAEAGCDVVVACAFSFEAHATEFDRLGRVPVLKARMNADLHMAGELRNTGKGNLFVIFGEPDIDILPVGGDGDDDRLQVKINGVDVFHPTTGEVRSNGADGIACWFVDTDYNEESFFVRHAYFLGANDPYKALKTTLKAEIDADAWASLHSDTSRPFARPASGRIAVKVINHLGDEVMKVFRV